MKSTYFDWFVFKISFGFYAHKPVLSHTKNISNLNKTISLVDFEVI